MRRARCDSKSFDLAKHFLSDHRDATDNHAIDLAEHIQRAIEDWIEYESGLEGTHQLGMSTKLRRSGDENEETR